MLECAALMGHGKTGDAIARHPQRELPDMGVLRGCKNAHINSDSGEDQMLDFEFFQQKLEGRTIKGGVPWFQNGEVASAGLQRCHDVGASIALARTFVHQPEEVRTPLPEIVIGVDHGDPIVLEFIHQGGSASCSPDGTRA